VVVDAVVVVVVGTTTPKHSKNHVRINIPCRNS